MMKRFIALGMAAASILVAKVADKPLILPNQNFEEVAAADGSIPSWAWWQREGKGSVELVSDAHEGKQAMHVKQLESGKDYAITCGKMYSVVPNDEYHLTMWCKLLQGQEPSLQAVSYNSKRERITWNTGCTDGLAKRGEWTKLTGFVKVPEDCAFLQFRLVGGTRTEFIVDDIQVTPGSEDSIPKPPPSPAVKGWATKPVVETFARSPFAQRVDDGVYVSWRLLADDAADVAFDVYRISGGKSVKVNTLPIRQTCDFMDSGEIADDAVYEVRVVGAQSGARTVVHARPAMNEDACQRFKLSDEKGRVGKVGICDLNGDGVYDYVVQHPSSNVDPWHKYWHPSKTTFKVDAFLADGTRLWTFDRGWSIENGIWYSPFVTADLNGDGRAEVILKYAEGDQRNTTGLDYNKETEYTDSDAIKGMVETGEEWIVVLDGMTGREIARAPWPSREGFESYNLNCRNQLAVARLDGKTPCVIALRGTYSLMKAEAWQLKDGKLAALWSYNNTAYSRKYRGQGAHTTLIVDIDGDGKDEILLGSAVLDDNGDPLWTTGKGHPDAVYYGDLLPSRPGMEIAYILETGQSKGGMCMVDAKTGKPIWQLGERTSHVHGGGMCADIDPMYPGVEFAGTNADGHQLTARRWLFAADGTLLKSGTDVPFGFAQSTAYWDGDLQRELCRGKMLDYEGGPCGGAYTGNFIMAADVTGDWREEILTSVPGEFRIYSTSVPAMDRRVCLMQDYAYRMRQQTNAQGYTSGAALQELPSATHPNLNLTFQGETKSLRVVVTAPQHQGIEGTVTMEPLPGVMLNRSSFAFKLPPAGIFCETLTVSVPDNESYIGLTKATASLKNGPVLRGQVPVAVTIQKLTDAIIAEAEKPSAEVGGNVHVREDKVGVQGKCVSHWDNIGHALSYKLAVKTAGRYAVVIRYCTGNGAYRRVAVDGKDYGVFFLPGSGGLGDRADDWNLFYPMGNKRNLLELTAGDHTITLTNTDGAPCNLDYVGLVKQR